MNTCLLYLSAFIPGSSSSGLDLHFFHKVGGGGKKTSVREAPVFPPSMKMEQQQGEFHMGLIFLYFILPPHHW